MSKEVRVLEDGIKQSGAHQLQLQVGNLPGGIYFLFAQTQDGIFTHKMLID